MIVRNWAIAVCAALVFAGAAQAGVPSVSAQAYLVENPVTGELLAQRRAWARVPIASITKLMTVLVTLDHARWNDVVRVQRAAATVGESTVNLRPGERIRVGDLVEGALIQSANDAADALADYVSHGDRKAFVAEMNAKAAELGLERTHFVRADGLDAPGHVSSAHDVALLAQEAMRIPQIRATVRKRTARIEGNRTLRTWNDLLGTFPGVYGVKTGHTAAAGWCEVAAVRLHGVTLYVTVLGSPTRSQRNADLSALLRWGISRYRQVWLVEPRRVYLTASVGYGRGGVPLVAAHGLARAVRVDQPLVERVVAPAVLELPVRRGQRAGEVRVYSGHRLVAHRTLVAARSVSSPGLGRRLGFYVGRTLRHVGGWFS